MFQFCGAYDIEYLTYLLGNSYTYSQPYLFEEIALTLVLSSTEKGWWLVALLLLFVSFHKEAAVHDLPQVSSDSIFDLAKLELLPPSKFASIHQSLMCYTNLLILKKRNKELETLPNFGRHNIS